MTNPPPPQRRPSRTLPARPSGAQRIDADELEKQAALKDVMDHAVRHTRAVTMAKPMVSYRARPIVLGALAALTMAFSVYVRVAKPDFIWGPDPAKLPAAQRDAGLRFGMFLLGQRIEQYRAARGAYPPSLDYLDATWAGMTYRVLNDSTFEIRTRGDTADVVFRSDLPVDRFLGQSVNIIRPRR